MSDHPAPFRLEAWQAGEADDEVARHVEACSVCRAAVDGLVETRRLFLAREEPADFVRRVAGRAREADRSPRRSWSLPARAAGVAAAVGIALLLVLVIVPRRMNNEVETLRLKGGSVSLAVVAKHAAGAGQTRHAGSLTARPGDELRVELTLARPAVLTVGVLEDSGAWIPLVEGISFAGGVQYLGQSLRLDARPATAWLIAGPPDAVRRAVKDRAVDLVAHLRIETEPIR